MPAGHDWIAPDRARRSEALVVHEELSKPVISPAARAHLRWALTDGVGPILFARLLERFAGAEQALGAPAAQLALVKGISRDGAERIARLRDAAEVEREAETAAAHGVRIICRADPEYPTSLRQIPDPPIVLYVKGELRPTDAVAIAVVGSRRCSIYGSEQARRFGELLAAAGFTVVSGLARGIDAFAHHGAVDTGGRSIAVFGRGLTTVYPPENRALAERMLENGAWLSELPMQATVRGTNFPSRNRIIAGMTLGTLVVEAAARSGALITARLASEYNREVFAVPGRAQDPTSHGANALIRDGGAKLVTCLEDILVELGETGAKLRPITTPVATAAASDQAAADAGLAAHAPAPALSSAEQRVYDAIGAEPLLQELVIAAVHLPVGEVLAALTALELKGLIKRLPGQLVQRTTNA